MEIECEETVIESCSPITTSRLNGNHETAENDTESEIYESDQVQSNLLVPSEDSRNLASTGTCLESGVTSNKPDSPISLQSHVSLR